jgi:hypothetical protein
VTREQQIRAALKLSELPPARREAGRARIETALDIMVSVGTLHTLIKACRSAAHTKAIKVYRKRLWQLEQARKAICVVEGVEYVPTKKDPDEPKQYELYPGAGGRWKQAFAVAFAYELLMEWWGGDEFITTTRKGSWWRLSAILYGDEDIDLFRHLRAFKPELSPLRRN